MSRVLVVGGGISGLAAATELVEAGHEVTVFEAAAVPGGNVRTDHFDGRILDQAANGWLDNEPTMQSLLARVGLADRVVPVNERFSTRWILADGRMQPAPLRPPMMVTTDLLSFTDKLRVLAEPLMPRGASAHADDPTADESVGDFVRRRLGPAFVDRMVGPMVAGIYAADPDHLSLRGALGRMFELEREHRSLFVAMARLGKGGAPPGRLQTLPGGAGELTATLATRLGDRVKCGHPVTGLSRSNNTWTVTFSTAAGASDTLTVDRVVLACPAPVQARLLRSIDPAAATALDGIPYAPVAVVCTAWKPGSWALAPEGFGVLMARGEADRIGAPGVLGALFTSSVFPQQAQEGEHLIRTILGGAIAPEVVQEDDATLLARTRRMLTVALGPETQGPTFVQIYRHAAGIPQYRPGHPARVQAVRAAEARHSGLHCVGNHLDGIGVKDCARAAHTLAAQIGAP